LRVETLAFVAVYNMLQYRSVIVSSLELQFLFQYESFQRVYMTGVFLFVLPLRCSPAVIDPDILSSDKAAENSPPPTNFNGNDPTLEPFLLNSREKVAHQ
jgi:hypothetical protein